MFCEVSVNKHLEADLSSQDHDAFGKAVSKCKGYTPECVATGKCQQDGDCFEALRVMPVDTAHAEIKRLNVELETLRVKQTIFESTLEHHIQRLNTSYNSLSTALSEPKRWAVHFARQHMIALQKGLRGERE